jgi:hypothetical protein
MRQGSGEQVMTKIETTLLSICLAALSGTAATLAAINCALALDPPAKIKFKADAISCACDLIGDKQHGSLINGTGQTEATMTVSPDGKLITIASGTKTLGYVALFRADELKLEDSARKELFALKQEADGHYKLKDASGQTVYKIKIEQYGLKIEDAKQQTVYKVHRHEDKLSLKGLSTAVVLSTKAQVPPMALACFGFDSLSRPQRAALAYALIFVRN